MKQPRIFVVSWMILAILCLMRFLPFLFPDGRFWGFNHLIFLPEIYAVVYGILVAAALAFPFFKSSPATGEILISLVNAWLYGHRRMAGRAILIMVAGAIFVLLAAPTHFLGDGYTLLANLSTESGTIFKWSEKGTTYLLAAVQSLYGPKNEATALAAFRTVSVIAGMITICFFILIAGRLTENRPRRVLILAASIMSATLLLFFGYVENYPLLWVTFTGFIYFGLSYLKEGRGLILCPLFLVVGLLVHMQMIVFLPALGVLVFSKGTGRRLFSRHRTVILSLVGVMTLLLLVLFVDRWRSDLYFENIFMPPFNGKPPAPDYFLFSLSHLADIVNQLLLLSPLLLLYLYFSRARPNEIAHQSSSLFLTLAAMGALLFLMVIDPKLGLPRDWDLFSLAAFPLNLLLFLHIPESQLRRLKGLYVSLVAGLMILNLPFLVTGLSRSASIEYVFYMIDLDREKSLPTIIAVRDYFRRNDHPQRADSMNLVMSYYHPDKVRLDRAFTALDNNNIDLARTLIKSVKPDRFSSTYHNCYSMLYTQLGDFRSALAHSDSAIQLRQYDERLYLNRAFIHRFAENYQASYAALKKGFRLNPKNPKILEFMADLHLRWQAPDSAYYYVREILLIDSTSADAYNLLTRIYARSGQAEKARKAFESFQKYGRGSPDFKEVSARLSDEIEKSLGENP